MTKLMNFRDTRQQIFKKSVRNNYVYSNGWLHVKLTTDHHRAIIQYLKEGNVYCLWIPHSDFTLQAPTSSQLLQW